MKGENMSNLSRKQLRQARQDGIIDINGKLNTSKFSVRPDIQPITDTQKEAKAEWQSGQNLMLHGVAGTGKTFLGLWFALEDVLKPKSEYEKIYIVRSTVETRKQGFMPGSPKQKAAVYEDPYPPIVNMLIGRGDAYTELKSHGKIEFLSTSFLRGVTFDNAIVVVDEMQNMCDGELHTIMTRVGENCKIFFCGDIKQDDLTSERYKEASGIADFMRIIASMQEFSFVEFMTDDIVRSDLVRSYIIARDKLGL